MCGGWYRHTSSIPAPTTELRTSNANGSSDVYDVTLLLANSLHNRPEVLHLRKYTEIYRRWLDYARSASSNGIQKESSLTSEYESTMLLLHVYKVGDSHDHEGHCAIQGTAAIRNHKLGTSILQYSFTMERHTCFSVLAHSNYHIQYPKVNNNSRTPIKQTIKKTNRVYITITITQGENFIPLLDTMANKAFRDAVLHLYYHDTMTLKAPSP